MSIPDCCCLLDSALIRITFIHDDEDDEDDENEVDEDDIPSEDLDDNITSAVCRRNIELEYINEKPKCHCVYLLRAFSISYDFRFPPKSPMMRKVMMTRKILMMMRIYV